MKKDKPRPITSSVLYLLSVLVDDESIIVP